MSLHAKNVTFGTTYHRVDCFSTDLLLIEGVEYRWLSKLHDRSNLETITAYTNGVAVEVIKGGIRYCGQQDDDHSIHQFQFVVANHGDKEDTVAIAMNNTTSVTIKCEDTDDGVRYFVGAEYKITVPGLSTTPSVEYTFENVSLSVNLEKDQDGVVNRLTITVIALDDIDPIEVYDMMIDSKSEEESD